MIPCPRVVNGGQPQEDQEDPDVQAPVEDQAVGGQAQEEHQDPAPVQAQEDEDEDEEQVGAS